MSVPAFWNEAKQYVDLISNLMVEAVKTAGISADAAEIVKRADISADGAQMVKSDLNAFAMYLSASDGTVSPDEAAFLLYILGLPGIPSDAAASIVASTIRESNIYSKAFETQVPVSLQFAVAMDNALFDKGITLDSGSTTELLLNTYEIIGKHIIKSDGSASASEVKDFKIYMKTLHDYVNANFKGTLSTASNSNSSDTTGFVKQ